MFEVIESISEPIRMIAAPNTTFLQGLLAEVQVIDGVTVCGIASENQSIGVIGTDYTSEEMSFAKEDMIEIHAHRMIFRTDVFDIIASYEIGDALYCDESGVFTTRKMTDGVVPVSRMISPPCIEHGYFEALWL